MKIDLFSTTCFEHKTNSFGIEDNQPAVAVEFEEGTAKVDNADRLSIYFVPIDKNFFCYKANGKDEESLCDALLICVRPPGKYDFYFVELKSIQKSNASKGLEQLKSTIGIFKTDYPALLSCISKKTAFYSNKKQPSFQYSHSEECERFRHETGFRLVYCATIPIK